MWAKESPPPRPPTQRATHRLPQHPHRSHPLHGPPGRRRMQFWRVPCLRAGRGGALGRCAAGPHQLVLHRYGCAPNGQCLPACCAAVHAVLRPSSPPCPRLPLCFAAGSAVSRPSSLAPRPSPLPSRAPLLRRRARPAAHPVTPDAFFHILAHADARRSATWPRRHGRQPCHGMAGGGDGLLLVGVLVSVGDDWSSDCSSEPLVGAVSGGCHLAKGPLGTLHIWRASIGLLCMCCVWGERRAAAHA